MGNKILAAVIGGVTILGLALITSFVPLGPVNLCCCTLWAIGGGLLATFIYSRRAGVPVRIGDGALLGALAGLVGGLPLIVIFPLIAMMGGDRVRAQFEAQMRQMGQSPADLPIGLTGIFILSGIMVALVVIVLSTGGGLLGGAIFQKRQPGDGAPPVAPPPPPDFGGPAGGSYGSGQV